MLLFVQGTNNQAREEADFEDVVYMKPCTCISMWHAHIYLICVYYVLMFKSDSKLYESKHRYYFLEN